MVTKERVIQGLASRIQRSFKTMHKINQLLLLLFVFILKVLNLRNQCFVSLMSQFACGSKQDSMYFLLAFGVSRMSAEYFNK